MARWVSAMCGAIVVSACTRVAPAPTVTLAVPDRASANVSLTAAGDVVAARGVPDAAGQVQFVRERMSASPSAYPVVASTGRGFVRGWTDTSRVPSVINFQRTP